ncbi:hypothetical protein [Anabaena azotica]|uniref:MFS transporter n=1 Tax=Anabaena azotica FACHB-119 TaxID=947527 RepID=A0ABR8D7I4_9NOST|nr:hypothetical protein [Anabaena azotica]MBD2502654.1 hypothetical protein [Anabaena azotica FACHB-119]
MKQESSLRDANANVSLERGVSIWHSLWYTIGDRSDYLGKKLLAVYLITVIS